MFDQKVELCDCITRNRANELSRDASRVSQFYAQVTEFGGTENMYASRILAAGQIVFTTYWRKEIKESMFIYYNSMLLKIISVHTEGRRWRTHIICQKADSQDYRYVES